MSDPQETAQFGDRPRYRGAASDQQAPIVRAGRAERARQAGQAGQAGRAGRSQSRREYGVPNWVALLVLLAIAGIGGLIDQISGAAVQGAFNWALIGASLVAILIVRRSQMFGIVIAPPLVYFIASAGKLYFTSHGLKSRSALFDAAANWLVYGFPAIAGATAVVLLVAGIRLIRGR